MVHKLDGGYDSVKTGEIRIYLSTRFAHSAEAASVAKAGRSEMRPFRAPLFWQDTKRAGRAKTTLSDERIAKAILRKSKWFAAEMVVIVVEMEC